MIKKIQVAKGIFWVEIPKADLYILCGCPMDAIKHLFKTGLIHTIEEGGVHYETGPNAILLSDVSIQGEGFSNLSEFPVLQMIYRQGMTMPGHLNNKGLKPMLIGIDDQVRTQMEYINRGNYGLISREEIEAAGVTPSQATELMRMKLRFAFDEIKKPEDLIDTRIIGEDPVELRNGVWIERQGLNIYGITYENQTVTVDLNLDWRENYEPSYNLGFHHFRREYFSVIHTGEGDGWDVNRPCMGSILNFQGRLYLIDAGPNLLHTLTALGVGVNEIEGIFHTHAHDDHFNGLTVLLRSDHKIKYYATPLVRSSVEKKLNALLDIGVDPLSQYFEIHDLVSDEWNFIEGLEVKPVISPHPVETTVFFFRTLWENGYKRYAHLADIASLDVLRGMITENEAESGISARYYTQVTEAYLEEVDLKKIDCGGGLIHGKPEDFAEDSSTKIILSHNSLPFTSAQKEIGATTAFGMQDVLIPAHKEYSMSLAFRHLRAYFPTVPIHDLNMLLNCELVHYNPGSLIVKRGEQNGYMYFILSGLVEYLVADFNISNRMSIGSMAGEISGIIGRASRGTYKALSPVNALKFPCDLYVEFLKRNKILDEIMENIVLRTFLQRTWLFGEMLPCPLKSKIAHHMIQVDFENGTMIAPPKDSSLIIIFKGDIELINPKSKPERLAHGDFFFEESALFSTKPPYKVKVQSETKAYRIPGGTIADVPIVQWKLLESAEKRKRRFAEH